MSRHSTFAVPLRDRSHRSRPHFVCLPTGTTLSQIITYVIAQRHGVELTAICPYHTSALVCTLDAPPGHLRPLTVVKPSTPQAHAGARVGVYS